MSDIVQLHRMNIGAGFRAYSLRGGEMAAPIDPSSLRYRRSTAMPKSSSSRACHCTNRCIGKDL